MSPMLLVAAREFRQIATTRSFWVTLLILPLAIVLSQVGARFLSAPTNVAYVVVDESGRYAPAIQRRIRLDAERELLGELAGYGAKWKLHPTGGQAVWGSGPHWFTEPQIAAFEAAGGLPAAQAQIARLKPSSAPDFRADPAPFVGVDPPAGVAVNEGPERFGATLAPHLKGDVATPIGPRPLALGVYIPANLGEPGATVRMWTNGRPNAELVDVIRQELTQVMRARALQASGLDMAALARVQSVTASVSLIQPPAGSGRELVVLRSALPLGLAYLLLMSLMISGAWMLQGLMEERSNKLLEAVLACITPDELLYGKLLGMLGVGAVMILAWIGFAIAAAFGVQGVVADFLRPALASLDSPWIGLALVYYFVAGYLCISMLFLAVGSISENMRDAQGYLTPMILGLTLPFVLMIRAVLQNPDGPLPRIMSWIPIYTPFAMMGRLGGGVSAWEVIGSGLVLAVFVGLELMLLGRLFRASVLQAGQPLRLRDLPRLMRDQPA
jgi:ABC-2 type transport system permease protein